jgi:S1-C subfamily serine protease
MFRKTVSVPIWSLPLMMAAVVVAGAAGAGSMHSGANVIEPSFRIAVSGSANVIVADITPDQALHLNSKNGGVLVQDVRWTTLARGDLIEAINGRPVHSGKELAAAMTAVSPGEAFYAELLRNGLQYTVELQRAGVHPSTSEVHPTAAPVENEILGIRVEGLCDGNSGVVVSNIEIGTPASAAGLRSGDVILEINSHTVHDAAEFVTYLRKLNGKQAALTVQNSHGQVNVIVMTTQP